MTLNQLKYALMLRRKASFKQASDCLGITQPGLSIQIQKLEEQIGLLLFDRSSFPITTTAEGMVFLNRAEEIVSGFEQLEQFSVSLGEGYCGTLVVGIIPTLAPFIVPLFVDSLQAENPEFRLDIHEMTTEKVVQGVREGELDAGLISTPANLPDLNIEPLFYERFFFYTSAPNKNGPLVELKDIDYKKLWLLNEGNCFRDQVNNFCDLKRIRMEKDFVFRSNSIDALIRIVDSKGGLTILPELTTLSLTTAQEENLQRIGNKAREISLIKRKVSNKDRFTSLLTSYIRMNIPRSMLISTGLDVVDPGING